MTGWWLGSYILLWIALVIACTLIAATLRQIGLLRLELGLSASEPEGTAVTVPEIEDDGPLLGSRMPDLVAETINGIDLPSSSQGKILLTFMSATCPGCQDATGPLNVLAADKARCVQPVVIMRAEEETCRAFLNLFPLPLPVICDDRHLTMEFDIHRNPFGLLYDERGTLVRKGIVENWEDVLALLEEKAVPSAPHGASFSSAPSLEKTTSLRV